MPELRPLACLLASTCALAWPTAEAANGGIDYFWSSATQVQVGESVSFEVAVSLFPVYYADGGSSWPEPPPQEGYQEWNVNWYAWEFETLRSVWLQAGSEGFYDTPALAPGESYGTTWSFAVTFDTPGTYSFDLSGGWQSDVAYGYSNESAYRNCWYTDPDNPVDLTCDWWTWQYSDYSDWYTTEGSLWGGTINIEVLAAPVPEPSTAALLLAGAALVGARLRRRNSATRR